MFILYLILKHNQNLELYQAATVLGSTFMLFIISEYEVGLSLGIETKSQNEEDELHQIFYKVVEEYNTNPVLLRNMNSTLKTNISKINFSYTQGDPYVKCLLIFKSKNERKNFHEIMKDSYVPDFFTNYLNSTGLSTDLGRDFKEEVDIIVIELPGYVVQ